MMQMCGGVRWQESSSFIMSLRSLQESEEDQLHLVFAFSSFLSQIGKQRFIPTWLTGKRNMFVSHLTYASFLLIRLENSRNCRLYSMCLQTPNMSRGVSSWSQPTQRVRDRLFCETDCVKPSAPSKNGNKGRFHGLKNIRQRT